MLNLKHTLIIAAVGLSACSTPTVGTHCNNVPEIGGDCDRNSDLSVAPDTSPRPQARPAKGEPPVVSEGVNEKGEKTTVIDFGDNGVFF